MKKSVPDLEYPSSVEQQLSSQVFITPGFFLLLWCKCIPLSSPQPPRGGVLCIWKSYSTSHSKTQGAPLQLPVSLPVWTSLLIDTPGGWSHANLSINGSDLRWIWTNDLSHWTSARKCLVFTVPDDRSHTRHGISPFLPAAALYTLVLGVCLWKEI